VPTVFTHPVVALGLSPFFRDKLPGKRWIAVGALCTVVPDLDTIGFRLGIHYGDLLGHRGLSHSIAFALMLALGLAMLARERRGALFFFLFLCTISHGLLDALTNGGLGVAFFAPFDETRYFFPWRPIAVSPIGTGFFSARGLIVLGSELLWIWAPALLLYVAGTTVARRRREAAQALERDRLDRERRDYIVSVQDEMQKVLEDRSLGIEEARARFGALDAQLVAIDLDGGLQPLIEDNREWFAEQMAKREAATGC
jgi:inner membrane protein